jgi:competence protein ComEA
MKPLAALTFLGIAVAIPAFAAVNVNTAQQSELQSTRGLDKMQAKSIIEYRNGHGPYRSLEDLEKVIGEPAAEKIASQVAFDGPPYIGPPKPVKGKKKKKAES